MAADSNTDSAPASDGTSTDHSSEFSKGTGAEDSSIWEKHFGKEAKEPAASKRGQDKASTKEATGSRGSPETPEKERKGSVEKSERDSKASSKNGSEKREPSTKQTDERKQPESSSSKDPKSKQSDESKTDKDSDPEAPLKKARDLYKQAQKTEDRREARKLYKRAMVEAFGELPEEFDDRRYAAVRTERQAAKAALDQQAKKNEERITEAAGRLKPAIYVMRQLEGAGLGDKLTVPMVERAIHVMKALRSLEDGDFTQLAEVVSRAAGCDHDTAMQRFVKGTKVTPEGRAARAAAAEAQERAARAEARMAELERKLSERDSQQTEAQKKQERERQQADARTRYLEDIQETLGDHPVLKLPRGAERVMAYQIRHADPKLKSARYSHQQVADKIVASERRRLQAGRHLLDTEGQEVPARSEERPRRIGHVSRTETVDAGVSNPDPMASFDRIFDKHAAAGGERRRR